MEYKASAFVGVIESVSFWPPGYTSLDFIPPFVKLASDTESCQADVDLFFQAAQESSTTVATFGCAGLAIASRSSGYARQKILDLSVSRKSGARLSAVLAIDEKSPLDLRRRVLSRALADKSSRVRRKAIDWVGILSAVEMVDDLEKLCDVETDEENRAMLLDLLPKLKESGSSCD